MMERDVIRDIGEIQQNAVHGVVKPAASPLALSTAILGMTPFQKCRHNAVMAHGAAAPPREGKEGRKKRRETPLGAAWAYRPAQFVGASTDRCLMLPGACIVRCGCPRPYGGEVADRG